MRYIVVETGARNVAQADYKGYRIQVVSGYSIDSDNYPFHVYVQPIGEDGRPTGPREKRVFRTLCSTSPFVFKKVKPPRRRQPGVDARSRAGCLVRLKRREVAGAAHPSWN
jgi:hypothetical protein